MGNEKYMPKIISEVFLVFLSLIITIYIPTLSFIGMFILIIPIVILYLKYNINLLIVTLAAIKIIISIIYNPMLAIVAVLMYGVMGITLGYCIKKKRNSKYSIIITAIIINITNVIRVLIYTFMMKQGLMGYINLITGEIKKAFIEARDIYISSNVSQEAIDMINEVIKVITIENLIITIPIIFIIYSFIEAYLGYFVAHKVLRKIGYEVKEIIPLSRMYVPNRFAAILIIIECLGIILNSQGIRGMSYVVNISQLVVSAVISFNGIAYIIYLLKERFKVFNAVIAIILVLTVSIPIFSNIFFILGIMDILLNLRELDPNPIRISKSRK